MTFILNHNMPEKDRRETVSERHYTFKLALNGLREDKNKRLRNLTDRSFHKFRVNAHLYTKKKYNFAPELGAKFMTLTG